MAYGDVYRVTGKGTSVDCLVMEVAPRVDDPWRGMYSKIVTAVVVKGEVFHEGRMVRFGGFGPLSVEGENVVRLT